VIVQTHGETLRLITQPDHAVLARRMMDAWRVTELPEPPRRASVLHAIEAHDDGWRELDEAPIVGSAGEIADFIHAPAPLRKSVWPRSVARLASDPWAAALVAQHSLEIYAPAYRRDPEWRPFFDEMTTLRGQWLTVSGLSLELLERDYRFVRIADLLSLTFCNEWTEERTAYGFAMRWDAPALVVRPDPFAGAAVAISVSARELPNRRYRDAADAAAAWRAARIVTVSGTMRG
jgi:uncharacterized protein DUF3891